ncbi:MAG: NYN domain-containing protein, partial [Candidatus Taylorbacteria bacterium]|nr:NYN domain-containing protein [Candidatus Taylorbacteria bacterium]
MNTLLIIDGENFKGKLKNIFEDAGKNKPIWHEYDFKGLFDRVLKGFNIDETCFYFARVKEHEKSKVKSKQLIEEQRQLKTHLEKQGFHVVLSGRVRGQMEKSQTGKDVLIFREKGVDVKIAVDMVSLSCDKKVMEIILCSSDSDLQPAIKEAKDRNVSCVYLGFEIQPNKGISYTTSRTILIRNSEVLEFEKIKEKKQKRVVIVHRWSGGPNDDWRPWLKNELEKNGCEVFVPEMPDTEAPIIEKWVNCLSKIVGVPDSNTYFIGHSIGCQAILRYLETVNTLVGGAIFVA